MGELPPKLFFRIGEVATLVGVEPHVLRYWEREFRSIRPTKSAKGQRVYSRKDVENLLRVRDLLYRDGFTIAGAKKKLQRTDRIDVAGESHSAISMAVDAVRNRATDPTLEADHALETERELENEAEFDEATDVRTDMDEAAALDAEIQAIPEKEPTRVYDTLVALRSEIEDFLAELSSASRR